MRFLKKITVLCLILIGLFSFSKTENNYFTTNFDTEEITQSLQNRETSCRPSSDLMLYVETSLVKKSRGFKTITASVFILDRVSGISSLLANEDIVIPNHKDSVLDYDIAIADYEKSILKNGDRILNSGDQQKYSFKELIKYEVVYKSYVRSTSKLLNIKRNS